MRTSEPRSSVFNASRLAATTSRVALSAICVSLAAQVTVPMLPVPMTLQSAAVVLVGGLLVPAEAVVALALYVIAGAAGLPVFADGAGGVDHVVGPTAGYIAGFIAAAAWVSRRSALPGVGFRRLMVAMVGGHAVILVCGVGWLSSHIGLKSALSMGALPFIPGMLCKSLVSALVVAGWRLRKAS